MYYYILQTFKDAIKNIKDLQEESEPLFHEFEFRFSDFKPRFDSDVGKNVFLKVFKSYEGYDNTIIIDWIYSQKAKWDFFGNTEIKNTYNMNRMKFLKKYVYKGKNQFNVNYDDYKNSTDFLEDYPEFSIKNNKKNATEDIIRMSYATEEKIDVAKYDNTDLLHIKNRPLELIRFKNRFSKKISDFLQLDMTIVKDIDVMSMRETGKTEYIIEIELVKVPETEEDFISIKNTLMEIVAKYYNKEKHFFSIQGMNPHTIEKKDINFLSHYEYTLTDKADGIRTFMIFLNKQMFLYNPKTQEKIKVISNMTDLDKTIIDGEYLEDKGRFLAFDLIMYNNQDVRPNNLKKRLEQLQEIEEKYKAQIRSLGVVYKVKKFYFEDIFQRAKDIWTNRYDMFDYELDGLIFTPVDQIYTSDKQIIPVLKWKEKISIDIRVDYNPRENFTYFHHSSAGPKNTWWNIAPHEDLRRDIRYRDIIKDDFENHSIKRLNWFTTKGPLVKAVKESKLNLGKFSMTRKGDEMFTLGLIGSPKLNSQIRSNLYRKFDILEYEFDFVKNQWILIRSRTFDKEKPNAYKTIESVVKSIVDYISIEDVFNIKLEKVENIGELYNLTSDSIKRKPWRFFNNFVKNVLYTNNNDSSYHMELACGKGGDIQKWISNGYKNILAIDSSKEEIYGENGVKERLEGLGFTKMGYYHVKDDIKVTFIWGDISNNIRDGSSGLSVDDKEKLDLFFDNLPFNWKGFNTISIMFAIHYLFGDSIEDGKWVKSKTKFQGFMNNIDSLLKYGGRVFGAYLNGHVIPEDKEFIHRGDMMYKITHTNNTDYDLDSYDDFWKKRSLQSIKIQNEVWGNVTISEPKINKTLLSFVFAQYGFSSLYNDNFNKYINDFQDERKMKLSEAEKELISINNTFNYTKINVNKFTQQLTDSGLPDIKDIVGMIERNEIKEDEIKRIYNIFVGKEDAAPYPVILNSKTDGLEDFIM